MVGNKAAVQDDLTLRTFRRCEDCLLLNRLHHILELLKLLSRFLDLLPALDNLLGLCDLHLCLLDGLFGLLFLGSIEWIVRRILGRILLALPLLVLHLLLLVLSLDGSALHLGIREALLYDGIDRNLVVNALDALDEEGAGVVLALDAKLLHVGHGGVEKRLGLGRGLVEDELSRTTRAHHAWAGRWRGRVGLGLGFLATTRGLASTGGLGGGSVLAGCHFGFVSIFCLS